MKWRSVQYILIFTWNSRLFWLDFVAWISKPWTLVGSQFEKKVTKLRIASFVHGSDGLGNQNFPPPLGKAIDQSAAEFLVEKANQHPGKVTVVALGTLTNIAMVSFMSSIVPLYLSILSIKLPNFLSWLEQAIEIDPGFPQKIGQIVILGGAFAVNGNVNPAAEANVSTFCNFVIVQIHLGMHLLNSYFGGYSSAPL